VLTDLPLARSATDSDDQRRTDPRLLAALRVAPDTRVVLVHRALVAADEAGLRLWRVDELPELSWEAGDALYLGRDDDHSYVALRLPPDLGEVRDLDGVPVDGSAEAYAFAQATEFGHLRDLGDRLNDRDAGLATTAIALSAWHERNSHCPRCGAATDVAAAGWERHCVVDGEIHYPRTDAAVIMAVVDTEDRILLGHAAHWPENRFSTLAGYVEPGESLENAVRREVWEETRIEIDGVEYRGSQPWPFPCSLMMAFRARVAEGSDMTIVVDGEEITDARFFTREELGNRVAAGEVILPMRSSIARALIEEWYGRPLP